MTARFRQLAFWTLLSVPAAAQLINDPANLMGERVSAPALADTLPIDHGAPALEQLLRKLRTRASMMLIVAHPDDEDGGLLTYESRGMGARVSMLTLTRGEGGQNLMSADFDDALGLIRTQELLAADRYMGVDQMFGTEVDFGFSKTKEETFKQWGHDRVLYDAVRAVRLYRPLVLASVFVGGVTDGHGHHQVAGEICQEVFLAAADPKVFPEMGLPAWAPLRVYARVPFARVTAQGMFDYATGRWAPPRFHNYVTGGDIAHEPSATVTIHEGDKPGVPAFEGDSYVQFARRGLAMQKSQIGAGVRVPPAGVFDVGYTLMASRTRCATKAAAPCLDSATGASAQAPVAAESGSHEDLFNGIDTSLAAIADLAPSAPARLRATLMAIDARIAEAQTLYNPQRPASVEDSLLEALRMLDTLLAESAGFALPASQNFNLLHELKVKRVQLNDALVLATGIDMTASARIKSSLHAPRSVAIDAGEQSVLTQPFEVELTLRANPGEKVSVRGTDVNRWPKLAAARPLESVRSIKVGSDVQVRAGVSRPYFSRPNHEQPFYDTRTSLRNAPETPGIAIDARLEYRGVELTLSRTVEAGGASLRIVPPVSIQVVPRVAVRPLSAALSPIAVRVTSESGDLLAGPLHLDHPDGWSVQPLAFGLRLTDLQPGAQTSFKVRPESMVLGKRYRFSATVTLDERDLGMWGEAYRAVGYPGIPYTNYYTPATSEIIGFDVTTAPSLKIAYLPGTGDDVAAFLPSIGITPTILAPGDLTAEKLRQYDAVVLGVRAYAAHPELAGAGSKPLNDYAAQGGVVIVQYNSGGFDPASAPFPYQLPGDPAHNVVEEAQPVTVLKPEAPLLTWPNRITAADFDGWVEERGHGFASEWAPEYESLLETHDVDQESQKGGLLVAKTGKGAYIYCALALYRQLPEGVPGAYRLTANLLSYAKNPKR